MATTSQATMEGSSHSDVIIFWPSDLGSSENGWIIGWRLEHTWLVAGIVHDDDFERISNKMDELRKNTCFCCSCDATTKDYPTGCGGCTRKLCFQTTEVLAYSSRSNNKRAYEALPFVHVSQEQLPLYFMKEGSLSRLSFSQVVVYDSYRNRSPTENKRRLQDIVLYATSNSSSYFSKEILGRIIHANAVLKGSALPRSSTEDEIVENRRVENYLLDLMQRIRSAIPYQSYFLDHVLRKPPLIQIMLRAVANASRPQTLRSAGSMCCRTCQKRHQNLMQSHHADIDQAITRLNDTIRCVLDLITGVLGGLLLSLLERNLSTSFHVTKMVQKQFDWLRMLLDWMETFPIGFKLNVNLTLAMGRTARAILTLQEVFVYKPLSAGTYYFFQTPFLPLLFGLLVGGSGMLTMICDIWRLAALHVIALSHAFHLMFSVEVFVLGSSWRLFRGKKRNILRQRTDTMNYDSTQLLFGTILFTAALFLLTTVLVYNVVFSSLHLLVIFTTRLLLAIFFILYRFRWGSIWLRLSVSNWFVANVHLGSPQPKKGKSAESGDITFLVPGCISVSTLVQHAIDERSDRKR